MNYSCVATLSNVFKGVAIVSKLDDEFFEEPEFEDIDSVQSKKISSDRKRLLRERIELREIARDLDMSTDDWKEAFPDV